jgi:hypothetical protein
LIEGKEEKRDLKRLEEMIDSIDGVETIGVASRYKDEKIPRDNLIECLITPYISLGGR